MKMMFLKTISLMIFAFGIAIMAKYIGFYGWVENNAWISFPMVGFGAVGIIFSFGNEEP